MKKKERRHRLALALVVSIVIFIIQSITALGTAAILIVLFQTGILENVGKGIPLFNRIVFLMALLSTLIGLLVTALSNKITLKPVNRLISQMNRLASGDYSARISFGKPVGNHKAFREISNSFNKMAEELESTEMLRSDFINNFSHEFKTPIVSISGFAKVLRRGNLTPEQQQEYLAVIEEESLRLSYMANNVLNLTKVENQTILTDVSQYNLSEQIRAVILLLEDKWSKKNLDFNLRVGEHRIEANEELLKHVWINLLDNAVKFSEESGCIDVGVEEKGDRLIVTVGNKGQTIPQESINRIFNKFYQADESHSAEGNGIGLAIVKRVVELHEGTVSVRGQHGMTVFTVELPKSQ